MSDSQDPVEKIDKKWQQAKEKNEELGDGLIEGKVVKYSVADGKAVYEIVDIGETVSTVEYRDDLVLNNYRADVVDHSTGHILTANLKKQMEKQDSLRKFE